MKIEDDVAASGDGDIISTETTPHGYQAAAAHEDDADADTLKLVPVHLQC